MLKAYKVFAIAILVVMITGCQNNEEYLGTYESSNGSEIVLKTNGKCDIKVVTKYHYSGDCNKTYDYRDSVGGRAMIFKNGTMCYYDEEMTKRAKSCFYEFYEDYIVLTHDIDRSTTNRYDFSNEYETLTWDSTGKTYNKK